MYEVVLIDHNYSLPYKYKSKELAFLDAGYMSSQGYAVEIINARTKTLIRSYNTN